MTTIEQSKASIDQCGLVSEIFFISLNGPVIRQDIFGSDRSSRSNNLVLFVFFRVLFVSALVHTSPLTSVVSFLIPRGMELTLIRLVIVD